MKKSLNAFDIVNKQKALQVLGVNFFKPIWICSEFKEYN